MIGVLGEIALLAELTGRNRPTDEVVLADRYISFLLLLVIQLPLRLSHPLDGVVPLWDEEAVGNQLNEGFTVGLRRVSPAIGQRRHLPHAYIYMRSSVRDDKNQREPV